MPKAISNIFWFCIGAAASLVACILVIPHPTYTETPSGWKLEHVPMPPCRDDWKRTVNVPEQDEVDALSVTCESTSALDAQKRK